MADLKNALPPELLDGGDRSRSLDGRIFAAPTANVGESWHPFAKGSISDGKLSTIDMPRAEIGFAVASHYLWIAEGARNITVDLQLQALAPRGCEPGKTKQPKGEQLGR